MWTVECLNLCCCCYFLYENADFVLLRLGSTRRLSRMCMSCWRNWRGTFLPSSSIICSSAFRYRAAAVVRVCADVPFCPTGTWHTVPAAQCTFFVFDTTFDKFFHVFFASFLFCVCYYFLCFFAKTTVIQLWTRHAHLLQCLGQLSLPPPMGCKV